MQIGDAALLLFVLDFATRSEWAEACLERVYNRRWGGDLASGGVVRIDRLVGARREACEHWRLG